MKLTEEQAQIIFDNLKLTECINCKSHNTFQVDQNVHQLISHSDKDKIEFTGNIDTAPVAAVICTSCGYTMLFNLIVTGIVKE